MKVTVTKISSHTSKLGGIFYYIFAKTEAGKSVKCCVYPQYRNFQRWERVLSMAPGTVLDNCIVRGDLLDADSFPIIKE